MPICAITPVADEPRRTGDYRLARILVAVVLSVALTALLILDALSAEYELQPATVGLLGSMILVLLAVEVPSIFRTGK